MYKIIDGREKVRDLELTDGIHIIVILFRIVPSPVSRRQQRKLRILLKMATFWKNGQISNPGEFRAARQKRTFQFP